MKSHVSLLSVLCYLSNYQARFSVAERHQTVPSRRGAGGRCGDVADIRSWDKHSWMYCTFQLFHSIFVREQRSSSSAVEHDTFTGFSNNVCLSTSVPSCFRARAAISSSLAVELASSLDHDLRVLIVSTDPAHSLGDALDVDLRGSGDVDAGGKPRPTVLSDALTGGRLAALEVDGRAALDEFRKNLELFDVAKLSSSIGMNVSPAMLEELGLGELGDLIRNPPPGLDELVALANVLDPKNAEEYDVIVVDTAPTGHTLRMLQLPQFLDGFLQTLLTLRQKLKGLMSTLQMFMGQAPDPAGERLTVDDALAALEKFQRRAAQLRARLRDADATKFVVVTIPTVLSVRESERLMSELDEQGICVSDLVVNQCVSSRSTCVLRCAK